MSRKDETLQDKYATGAVRFGSDLSPPKKSVPVIDTGDLEGFSSVTRKIAQEKEVEKKPDGLFTRKAKRIFGAVGEMRAKFW